MGLRENHAVDVTAGDRRLSMGYYCKCHVKMGTPGPQFHVIGDPIPHFRNILGTPASPVSYEIGDPSMKMGFFFWHLACMLGKHI